MILLIAHIRHDYFLISTLYMYIFVPLWFSLVFFSFLLCKLSPVGQASSVSRGVQKGRRTAGSVGTMTNGQGHLIFDCVWVCGWVYLVQGLQQ